MNSSSPTPPPPFTESNDEPSTATTAPTAPAPVASPDASEPPTYDESFSTPLAAIVQPQTLTLKFTHIHSSETSDPVYELSRKLTDDKVVGTKVLGLVRIDRAVSRTAALERNDTRLKLRERHIYDINKEFFSFKLSITGKRRKAETPKYMTMTESIGLKGMGWEVRESDALFSKKGEEKLVRAKKCSLIHNQKIKNGAEDKDLFEFQTHEGEVVAVEKLADTQVHTEGESATTEASEPAHVLEVLKPLDQKMLDLLVVTWCGRLWVEGIRRTERPMRSFKDCK